jgi:2-keto-4-pentenoate hydratase/2-oxohepta-3-ene-1,7-dioic acid hydratase in catechol pathway
MNSDDIPFRMKITLPGTDRPTPVGKLLCIGRNYAEHADEMGGDVPDQPMVFLKPATAVIRNEDAVQLPPQSHDVHHEVELVAVIGKEGKAIPRADALDYVSGYAVGLDMTARDLQANAKERRHPWSVAKGFDTFAPLGPITPAGSGADPQDLTLRLHVNGETRQEAHTRHMIFSVAELIHYCSQIFTLEPGDLLYTGTPSGVGPVEAGDELEATATGVEPLRVRVTR